MPLAKEIITSFNKQKKSSYPMYRLAYYLDLNGGDKNKIVLIVEEDRPMDLGYNGSPWTEMCRIELDRNRAKRLSEWLKRFLEWPSKKRGMESGKERVEGDAVSPEGAEMGKG